MPLMVTAALGLVSVMVRVEVPPSWILVGANDLVILGGAAVVTVSVAAALVLPALVVVIVPVVLLNVLVGAGAVALVTLTLTVQLPLGAKMPPEMPNVFPPAAPPTNVALEPAVQLMVVLGDVAFTMVPAGAPAG